MSESRASSFTHEDVEKLDADVIALGVATKLWGLAMYCGDEMTMM